MTNTPILNITQVAQAQSNKELTINDAIIKLENATQAQRTAAITAAHTISQANYTTYFKHIFTGTFGATTVTVPNTQRLFYVQNNTNGDLTVRAGSFAATVVVPTGEGALLYCDGSDEISTISAGGSGGATDHSVSFFLAGDGVDENKVLIYVFNKDVDFATNMAGSETFADTPASTGTVSIDVQKNGASIGSIDFAVSSATATFTVTATSFTAGDRISFVCPAAFDDLAGIAISLLGTIP